MSGDFILYLVLGCLIGAAVIVFGLAWIWHVPRGEDDGFRSGGRPFDVR